MTAPGQSSDEGAGHRGVAVLLSKLGFHASRRFAQRLEPLGLELRHTGILRAAAAFDGQSQQALAERLGMAPSRLVGLLDDLESRGLLQRTRSAEDRRANLLRLTAEGRRAIARIAELGAAHEADLCRGLSADERSTLAGLLQRIADAQGIDPEIHPGLKQ